jgi:ComF family protein
MNERMIAFGRAFLNLVYPLSCCACGRKMTINKGLCGECVLKIHKNEDGMAACRYEGVLKEAIHFFKYKGLLSLSNTFSHLLFEFINKNIDMKNIDEIVPVPLHRVKERERGFNQARLLALPISKMYNIPISSCVVKTKVTQPQSGLSRTARLRNLKRAFSIKRNKAMDGKKYTTGTTIDNIAKVLKRAGANSIKVVTLARGI